MPVIIPTTDIVDRPQAHGYDGTIDNVLIRLGVSPTSKLEDISAEATPPRIDTSETAEDVRDETGRRYSRANLSGGAGLDFLHTPQRPPDAAIRYWDSKGVDVFATDRGDIYGARLMHRMDAENIGTDLIDVCQIDGTIFYARAAGIYELGVGPIRFALTGITRLFAMGNSLYSLDATNGVSRFDPPSFTQNNISTTIYDDIWPAKSRVVAVLANVVHDATDDSVLRTLPPIDTVTSVIDAGPAILMLATTGTIYVHTLSADDVLVAAGESSFTSEVPVLATESRGVIGIVTSSATEAGGRVARFYTAKLGLSGAYELSDMQLIYQVGDRDTTEDLTPQAVLSTRDSIYVAIPEEGTTEVTLWRYYLPTGGYARGHSVDPGTTETVSSMVEVDDRMFVCLDSEDLYKEADVYVGTGYAIGPLADFFTSDDKQWVGAELSGVALPTGAGLELYNTTDPALINDEGSTSWQLVVKLLAGEVSVSTTSLSLQSRYHLAKVIWRADSSRVFSPEFRSYSFRALPNPERDVLLRIPINVSDQVESPGRRAHIVKGRGQAIEETLRAYEGSHVLIELFRPALKIRGLIERFESTIEEIPQYGAVRRIMYARIRGSRLATGTVTATATSGASLGQDIAGRFIAGRGVPTE